MLIRATISSAFAVLLDHTRVPGSYYFRSPHQNHNQVSLCLFETGKMENQAVFCTRPHRKVQRRTDSSKVYVLRPPNRFSRAGPGVAWMLSSCETAGRELQPFSSVRGQLQSPSWFHKWGGARGVGVWGPQKQ